MDLNSEKSDLVPGLNVTHLISASALRLVLCPHYLLNETCTCLRDLDGDSAVRPSGGQSGRFYCKLLLITLAYRPHNTTRLQVPPNFNIMMPSAPLTACSRPLMSLFVAMIL